MTTKQLDNKLTSLLKKYIKVNGFYNTGKLYKSINFKVTDSPSLGLKVMLDVLPYLWYLDDGKLLDKFFAQPVVIDLFIEYASSKIDDIIENIEI